MKTHDIPFSPVPSASPHASAASNNQLSLHDLFFSELRQQRREGCLAMAFSCLPTTLIDLVCVHNWLGLTLHQPGEENQPLKSRFGNLNVTKNTCGHRLDQGWLQGTNIELKHTWMEPSPRPTSSSSPKKWLMKVLQSPTKSASGFNVSKI